MRSAARAGSNGGSSRRSTATDQALPRPRASARATSGSARAAAGPSSGSKRSIGGPRNPPASPRPGTRARAKWPRDRSRDPPALRRARRASGTAAGSPRGRRSRPAASAARPVASISSRFALIRKATLSSTPRHCCRSCPRRRSATRNPASRTARQARRRRSGRKARHRRRAPLRRAGASIRSAAAPW